MKHLLITLFLALLITSSVTSSFAQQNDNSTELFKQYRVSAYELGFSGLGYHFINIMPEKFLNGFHTVQNRGLMFKRSINEKFIARVVFENERFSINHAGTQYYEFADSMNIAGNYSGNKLSLGLERRWQVSDHLYVNSGIDLFAAQYVYYGFAEHLPSVYKHLDRSVYTTAGISPFIGLQYTLLEKFNMGFEVSFDATYIHRNSSIETVRPEPGAYTSVSNAFDVNPSPVRRVFVTYSF